MSGGEQAATTMAPIATADLEQNTPQHRSSVYPARDANVKLKELWSRHGDPQSSRYSNPDLTSLASLICFNARTNPRGTAYLVPREASFETISWRQFDLLTDVSAAYYAQAFSSEISTGNAKSLQPTIALLGTGHTFEYWVTQLGLCKLGVRLLLLSDKNADVARDHLLDVCNAAGIVVEPRYRNTKMPEIKVATMLNLDQLRTAEQPTTFLKFESKDVWNEHAMIIHSSGSTGLPKPIIHTNRSLMLIARMYRLFQSFVVENWYLCFPLYHIAGVSIILGGLPSGLPTTFPPEYWPPSPGAIFSAWRSLEKMNHPVDCLHCAPSVIEDMYDYIMINPARDFSPLLKLKVLQPGGAALSPVLLKKLTDVGVNVKTTYGSTEIGPPFRTVPDTRDNPNCYHVKNLFPDSPLVQMESQGDGLFECVVYKGFEMAAELWPTSEAPNPYRTNDLFIEDPPGSGLFVLQGRKDDVIVHSNGEKTNALPLQMAVEECHSSISKAVVFGTNQPCTSSILQLSEDSAHDLDDIFQAITEVCRTFPSYSRINRSMTVVLPEEQRLPVTPKGNVRRKEAWKLYGDRVDRLYETLQDGEIQVGQSIMLSDVGDVEFVRHCVANVAGLPIEHIADDDSFYILGLNSHMAIRLRPLLTQRFGKFPLMFIFEYSTVSKLAQALSCRRQGTNIDLSGRQYPWIQGAIDRYISEIKTWSKADLPSRRTNREVVYLTGATGALGNALLAELVTNDRITNIYCAVRGDEGQDRLAKQLQDRGYGSDICGSNKLIVVPYDMSDVDLGLDQQVYTKLASEVTTVIHNAWKMDFNQGVDMFEKDCLMSTLNLMRFCQENTKKSLIFTSSVATNMGRAASNLVIEEEPMANNPSLALETGYAQSKFIIEIVSQTYAEITKSPVHICRVGQLCGHTSFGSWNTSEMFPIMIATGLDHLKAMPALDTQSVNWLPVDICANAINTILSDGSSDTLYSVHNLVNPSAIPWSKFLDALETASGTHFERVSMREWVSRLQEASDKGDDLHGAKLLGFFETMVEDVQGEPIFDTTKTAALVSRLRDCTAVDEKLLRLYLKKWKADGFF